MTDVDLGFAEKSSNTFRLSSLYYPSKIGGKAAWLRWEEIPKPEELQCDQCKKQLIFLSQLYIPIDLTDTVTCQEEPCHKTIYLFCCLDGKCYKSSKKCIKVFRCVKKENGTDFTEAELEKKSDHELVELLTKLESSQPLCSVCGSYGDKKCSSCNAVSYCSKEHQVYDWKKGGHNKKCKGEENVKFKTLVFDEYEIVIEAEPAESHDSESNSKINEKYQAYLKNAASGKGGSIDRELEKEFSEMTASTNDDTFLKFKKRIQREPEQIIRYDLGGEPLWVSSENIPNKNDIPKCPCGSERQFEFQILPQMLNYLGIETTMDSIDWGTLCVYTCTNNCYDDKQHYANEFLWKQDFTSTDLG